MYIYIYIYIYVYIYICKHSFIEGDWSCLALPYMNLALIRNYWKLNYWSSYAKYVDNTVNPI